MNPGEPETLAGAEEAQRRRLTSMDTPELVELWERPMPAALRVLLHAELERRRYRTKGLPSPPPEDPTAEPLPTPVEIDARRMQSSGLVLLVIGLATVAWGAFSLWRLRGSGLGPMSADAAFTLVIGVSFLVLYRAARARPHPALTIGLLLYAGLKALQAVVTVAFGDPAHLLAGLPMTLLILLGLGYGAAASRRHLRGGRPAGSEPERPHGS